nr:YdcF family protein [Massilia sp. IC2-476]
MLPVLDLINAIPRNLILPPANLFLLILLGLLLWRRWPRAGRILAGGALALLALLSTPAVADLFVRPLEELTTPLLSPERAGGQAIVVLSAGRMRKAPEYGDRDIPDYTALARLRYAAHLQRRTGLPVLVSGGSAGKPTAHERSYSLADGMAAALRDDFGVPVRWVEGKSRDTADNAAFSAALLRRDGIKRVLLVTDAMHMARARSAFQRAGLEVVEAPTMFFGGWTRSIYAWIPSAEGLRRSWYATYELLGLVWYRMRSGGAQATQG